MARKGKIDLSFLGENQKITKSEELKLSQKQTPTKLRAGKFTTIYFDIELEKKILKSNLHNCKNVSSAVHELIKIGLQSTNEFVPQKNNKSISGKQFCIELPSVFDKYYQDTIKSHMLLNVQSRFIVEMIQWVLDGCETLEQTKPLTLDEDEILKEVIKKAILLAGHRHQIKITGQKGKGSVMDLIGKSASDYSHIEKKKTLGLINLAKSFNMAKLGIKINTRKETVYIDFGDDFEGLQSFETFLEWKAFD